MVAYRAVFSRHRGSPIESQLPSHLASAGGFLDGLRSTERKCMVLDALLGILFVITVTGSPRVWFCIRWCLLAVGLVNWSNRLRTPSRMHYWTSFLGIRQNLDPYGESLPAAHEMRERYQRRSCIKCQLKNSLDGSGCEQERQKDQACLTSAEYLPLRKIMGPLLLLKILWLLLVAFSISRVL